MPSSDTESGSKEAFAARLRQAIKDRKLSHRGLAVAAHTSKQSVTNWTQARHEPSLPQLRRLSAALGVSIAYLAEGESSSRSVDDEAAADVLAGIAELKLSPAVSALSNSAPSLLDLLNRAEQLARGGGSGPSGVDS